MSLLIALATRIAVPNFVHVDDLRIIISPIVLAPRLEPDRTSVGRCKQLVRYRSQLSKIQSPSPSSNTYSLTTSHAWLLLRNTIAG